MSTTPSLPARASSARPMRCGSVASMSRAPIDLTVFTNSTRIEINRPMIGSVRGKPSRTPSAPMTTDNEVNPSIRAWTPSATSAADPVLRSTEIR